LAHVNIIFLKILQVMAPHIDGASQLADYTTHVPFCARDVQHECIRRLQATFPITIAPHPIYAGSSCLIYQGTYKGRSVIVKIKRTGLQHYIHTSVAIARVLCRLIDRLALLPFISLSDICAEVTPNIVDQTDFTNELYNMHLFQRRFNTAESKIRIPETFDEFTTADENVIVMEQVKGAHIQHLAPADRLRMCERISHFNMTCIVEHGMFHGDLHCGNVLYHCERGVLYVLDFGITGYLSDKEVETLVSIMRAYAWKNFQRMAYLVVTEMTELPPDIPVPALVEVCDAAHAFLREMYQTRTLVQYDDITRLYELVKTKHLRIGRMFHRLQMSLGITNAMCTSYLTSDENNQIMHESFRHVLRYVLSFKPRTT
jgi:predicted unusual protein kinase regulating ubiquinone biosynthesis (AarF/ABC1/UbiB family)